MVNKKNKPKQKKNKEVLDAEKKNRDYRIYGVKKTTEYLKLKKEVPRPIETMIEKGGGVLMISAPPGSGKSNFLVNLFLRETLLKDEFEGGLYLISPTAKSDLSSEALVDYCDFVETEMSEELLEGIYSNIMSVPKEDRLLSCVIMDDCMGSNAMKQHTILNKMISSCRHLKTLFVFSTQAVKSINPNLRSCLSHSIVFYQPSTKQLNDVIELHSFMGGEDEFYKNYRTATDKKYGFLLNDFRDLKSYAWGSDLNEPELLWTRYDENGEIVKKDDKKDGMDMVNKGEIKGD